ncbi:MAG: hypothetical protein ABIW34_14740 [Ginsengibacter sp.]
MGRWSTGAITVNDCLRFKIQLFAKEFSKEFALGKGKITWSTGASIAFTITKNNFGLSLNLEYQKTVEGEQTPVNYRVNIESIQSDLGKGEIYFFVCPFTFKRCKTLYMGYGSLYFKSRKVYKHRIY